MRNRWIEYTKHMFWDIIPLSLMFGFFFTYSTVWNAIHIHKYVFTSLLNGIPLWLIIGREYVQRRDKFPWYMEFLTIALMLAIIWITSMLFKDALLETVTN